MTTIDPTALKGLNHLGHNAWMIAEESGWHDQPHLADDGTYIRLALIGTEVSEAIEAQRKEPWRVGEELADVIIRTVELAHILGVDLDYVVRSKMEHNRERLDVPARAGGKQV